MELLAAIEIECPHCGEKFEVEVDTSQGDQDLVEDCAICCCQVNLRISCRPGRVLDVRCAPG
jgi:hypothetical protein